MVSRLKQTKKKNEMSRALKRKLTSILELNLEKLLQHFGEESIARLVMVLTGSRNMFYNLWIR